MSERLPGDDPLPKSCAEVFCRCLLRPDLIGVVALAGIGWAFLRQGEILYGLPWLIPSGAVLVRIAMMLRNLHRSNSAAGQSLDAVRRKHHLHHRRAWKGPSTRGE